MSSSLAKRVRLCRPCGAVALLVACLGCGTAASDKRSTVGGQPLTPAAPLITDPGNEGDGDFTIAAPFQPAPAAADMNRLLKGRIIRFSLAGANSKVFPGDYSRSCAVYLPPGYTSGAEIPFMVVQDGEDTLFKHTPPMPNLQVVVEALIDAGKVPPMALISANPGGNRSVEYDTVSDAFTRFVETELLPEARRQAQLVAQVDLNLTRNPEGRGSYGGSSGGAAAFTMGWFGNFRRLLTFSGSFTPLKRDSTYPTGAAEYHSSLIPGSPTKPLRVFLQVGSEDAPPVNNGTTWKEANDRMAAALKVKGYHYRYVFAQDARHVDRAARAQYIPDALTWLWRGYALPRPAVVAVTAR